MINSLISFLKNYSELTDEEVAFLSANLESKQYNKDDILLKENEVSNAFFFVVSGCIRLYYMVDGEEKTAFFYTENKFVSSYESFTKQIPSTHYLQAVENSELVVISFENAYALLEKYPKFEFLARVMMEEELSTYQKIISTFITLSPEQRYLHLLKNQPELLQRIPQQHLATYVGVKAESLSRIKNRIFGK